MVLNFLLFFLVGKHENFAQVRPMPLSSICVQYYIIVVAQFLCKFVVVYGRSYLLIIIWKSIHLSDMYIILRL